jgi:hypothetical protein
MVTDIWNLSIDRPRMLRGKCDEREEEQVEYPLSVYRSLQTRAYQPCRTLKSRHACGFVMIFVSNTSGHLVCLHASRTDSLC